MSGGMGQAKETVRLGMTSSESGPSGKCKRFGGWAELQVATGDKGRADTRETSAGNDASPGLSASGTSAVSTTVGAIESCADHQTQDESSRHANPDLHQIQSSGHQKHPRSSWKQELHQDQS